MLAEKIKHCRKLLEFQIFENNGNGGSAISSSDMKHHAGGEQPLHAQSWSLDDMKSMVRMCGPRFPVHGCRHGMVCPKSKVLVKKPWGWFSSHKGIRRSLEAVCNHGHGVHKRVEGSLTASTATYPPLLCRRFAQALLWDSNAESNFFATVSEYSQILVGEESEAERERERERDR